MLLPLALPMPSLTYSCSVGVEIGARVLVGVGENKQVVGIVRRTAVPPPPKGELRQVIEVIDTLPLIGEIELRFIDWLSDYYLCSAGDVLRGLMSHLFSSDIRTLDCRYLKPKTVKIDGIKQLINPNIQSRLQSKLTADKAQFDIKKSITLLHTKSPINLPALVGDLLAQDSTVLVVAPTSDRAKLIYSELEPYFRTAICSTATPMKKRAALAIDLAVGLAPQVVVGTKVALGLGYRSLSGVVVTNEESFSYKSQRTPRISTRDAALMLSAMHNARSVLMSECPTVESYYNAHFGDWDYICNEAPQAELRSIVLEHGKDLISKYLKQQITETLAQNRRVVLMQNRRGLASYIECTACGYVPQCNNCSTSLTVHRHVLGCHYCGASAPVVDRCEKCGAAMELRGRGTQRIEDQLHELYPEARIVRIDSDAYADEEQTITENWQIAIGTKMVIDTIDWSQVGTAAILNVDNMLSMPDFRATEEAFRTVSTMAARCRDVGAELIVQSSHLSNDDIDDALNFSYHSFYIRAIEDRRASIFPPHSRMIRILFRGEQMSDVVKFAKESEASLRPIFAHRLSPMHQPLVERQIGDYIVEMLLKIERGRSSAKAKELLRKHLSPIISRARRSRVVISADSDSQ